MKNAKSKALEKAKGGKKNRIYIAPLAPETAFKRRSPEEQKQHEQYYKTHKGHYEMR